MRSLKVLIWPRYIASAPDLLGRIGRVLHWLVAFGVAPAAALLVYFSLPEDAFAGAALTMLAALLSGRALRYILSAE